MLPNFDLPHCHLCQQEVDALIDRVQDSFPLPREEGAIPQDASAIVGLGMYCLGLLHERNHPMTLKEYGASLHIPESPTPTLP